MATTNPITKIAREHETTWSQLHKRVSSVTYDFARLFPDQLVTFLRQKATSLNTSIAYFVPSLLTTTAFLLAKNGPTLYALNHEQSLNIYMMFIGHPGTGKSSAIQHACSGPMTHLHPNEVSDILLDRTTSSAFVKQLARTGNSFLVSPELFDVLNKLLKSDEETASGDAMLLCKLFSGEQTTYHYSTEQLQRIKPKTPFSILGCTQMPNAAKLIARMDHGQGLVDRFLVTAPLALCPTSAEIEEAINFLSTEPVENMEEIFTKVHEMHESQEIKYAFDDEAHELRRLMKDQFALEVTQCISDGLSVPPKWKKLDFIPRLAVSLHVFTNVLSNCLHGNDDLPISSVISKETLKHAITYVEHLESHKNMLCQFIKSITHDVCDPARAQPSSGDIKTAVLLFPGPVVTYRSFKQVAPRLVRGLAKSEFNDAIHQLNPSYDATVTMRVARSSQPSTVFVKKPPSSFFLPWPAIAPCQKHDYDAKFTLPSPKAITNNIKAFLLNHNYINSEQFNA